MGEGLEGREERERVKEGFQTETSYRCTCKCGYEGNVFICMGKIWEKGWRGEGGERGRGGGRVPGEEGFQTETSYRCTCNSNYEGNGFILYRLDMGGRRGYWREGEGRGWERNVPN